MINAFKYKNNYLIHLNIRKKNILKKALWIDLIKPNNHERIKIQNETEQNLATYLELIDIEASARFFTDKNGLHIHSSFFYANEKERAGNTTVAFTIKNEKLYTLRQKKLQAFNLCKIRILNKKIKNINAYKLLLNIFEAKIEQLANEIENIYSNLETLSVIIMSNQETNIYNKALSTLAILEDVGWKVRLCLMDTQRAINFLIRKIKLKDKQIKQAKEILQDTESLLPHNESLFQKVSFLLQAAMGFINIEQNRIIKIFSVVSVVFMPPTLVASSYGMNFKFMPELTWTFGYPNALILMILAGLAPYLYFKNKKWL